MKGKREWRREGSWKNSKNWTVEFRFEVSKLKERSSYLIRLVTMATDSYHTFAKVCLRDTIAK